MEGGEGTFQAEVEAPGWDCAWRIQESARRPVQLELRAVEHRGPRPLESVKHRRGKLSDSVSETVPLATVWRTWTDVTGVVGLGPTWLQGRWQAVVELKVGDAANRRRGWAGRAPGLQRPVHPLCARSRLPVPGRDHAGHPAAPGEQPAGDPEAQVVGGGPVPQGGGPPSQRSAPAPAVPLQGPLAAPNAHTALAWLSPHPQVWAWKT